MDELALGPQGLAAGGEQVKTRRLAPKPFGQLGHGLDDSQVPWGVEAQAGAVTTLAWKVKPSWCLVASIDHMIPPPAQRAMAGRAKATVVETAGSHAVYVPKPEVVAKLIEAAAEGVGKAK